MLIEIGTYDLLQEPDDLAEAEVLLEILHLVSLQVTQIVTLREECIYVNGMLPYKILHVMREPHLGGQRFGPFEMIHMLLNREVGYPEYVLSLCRIQQVKCIRLKLLALLMLVLVPPLL